MNRQLVSVIIPTYNSVSYIGTTIKSVLDQKEEYFDLEIIIIDDNSADNTVSYIKQNFSYPFLKVIALDTNRGPANARNVGIRSSKGEYIALLDADDNFCQDKLHKQFFYLKKNKDVDLVLTGSKMLDETGKHIKNVRYNFPEDKKEQARAVFLEEISACTPTLFFKRDLFEKTKGFDDTLIYLEDKDFLLKAIKNGKIAYIDQLLTNRIYRSDGMSKSIDENLFLKSRKRFELKAYETFESLKELKNKFWSHQYFVLGKVNLRKGKKRRSRKYFLKSIKKAPLKYKPIIGLSLSFCPSSIVKKVLN